MDFFLTVLVADLLLLVPSSLLLQLLDLELDELLGLLDSETLRDVESFGVGVVLMARPDLVSMTFDVSA